MPNLTELIAKLRGRTVDTELTPEMLQAIAGRSKPGLLATIGRGLDYPARVIRRIITGLEEPTGRDVLQKLGLAGRNRPGFDLGDVAGFGAEVALDPLTWVSGVGMLGKGGKLAARAEQLGAKTRALKAFDQVGGVTQRAVLAGERAQTASKLAEVQKMLASRGLPETLAPTWGGQARAGQRALVSVGVPFTNIEAPLIRAPKVLDFLQQLGIKTKKIPGVTPALEGIGKAFGYRHGITPEQKEYFEIYDRLKRAALPEAAAVGADISKVTAGMPDQALTDIGRARESMGMHQEFGRRAGQVKAEAGVVGKQVEKDWWKREYEKRTGRAEGYAAPREKKADTLEAVSAALKDLDPKKSKRLQAMADKLRGAVTARRGEILTKPATPEQILRLQGEKLRQTLPRLMLSQAFQKKGVEAKRNIQKLQTVGAVEKVTKFGQKTMVPEALRKVLELGAGGRRLLGEEIAVGARAPGSVLRSVSKEYMERKLALPAREWLHKSGLEKEFHDRFAKRMMTTREGSQVKRMDEALEMWTDEADQFFVDKKPDFEGHWFEMDPAKSYPQRLYSGRVAISAAELGQAIAKDMSGPMGPGMYPLADFLHEGPMHKLGDIVLPADPARIEAVLEKAGMGGRGVPMPAAQEFLRTWQKINGPEPIKQLLKAIDVTNSVLRFSVTAPFPAFWARNLLGDMTLSWLGDGLDLKQMPTAMKLARDPGWLQKMSEMGVLKGQSIRAITDELKEPGTKAVIEGLAGAPKGKVSKAANWFTEKGAVVENFTRTWHFLSKKAQGLTDAEAAQSVRRWLLDYSELAPFEREFMRRAIFFYQWPRKVVPLIIKSYVEKPGKMAFLTRLQTQPTIPREGALPEDVRQGIAIPLGKDAQGQPTILTGLGSPLEELNKFDLTSPEGGAGGAARQALRKIGNLLTPPLRVPIEMMTGHELYSDKPILSNDRAQALMDLPGLKQIFQTSKEKLPGGRERLRGDPYAIYGFRQLPTARLLSTLNKLANVVGGTEPNRSRVADLIQSLAGIRIKNMDQVDQLLALIRSNQQSAQELVRTGEMGQLPGLFAKRDLEGEKSPEAVALLKRDVLLRKILGSLRERAETK